MGKYGTLSVGRENDRRWKLSPEDIAQIKRMRRGGMVVRQIAAIYGVNPGTINYWINPRLRAYMRRRNAKRRRSPAEEREQYLTNKTRRRDLVRDKVRQYNRKQVSAWRTVHAKRLRPHWAKTMAAWRKRNRERHRATIKAWWHKKKCKCLKYGDRHIYGKGWPKGRPRK